MGKTHLFDKTFFASWSPDMAYILGYIYADGNLMHSPEMRGHYVTITSIDKERLEYFKKILKSQHRVFKKIKPKQVGKDAFVFRIGSTLLFNQLVQLGLTENKSKTCRLPKVPDAHMPHFLRGYFDGDGCVFIERAIGARGTKIDKAVRMIFTSGSKKFLSDIATLLLHSVGITTKLVRNRTAYQLRYSTEASMRLFEYLYAAAPYGAYMPRKFKTFKSYFQRRPDRVSNDIRNVLLYMDGLMVKR